MNKLDLEETTRKFHNIYEQVAKEYGYKTREDTKELDFNSPNGMTMLKTVEVMTTPYLEEIKRLNNIINELKWKPVEEYDKGNYDWVLVKYFDGDYECVPCVAEKRFGKWHSIDEKEIQFDVKYFMDMQQIDKIQELRGNDM